MHSGQNYDPCLHSIVPSTWLKESVQGMALCDCAEAYHDSSRRYKDGMHELRRNSAIQSKKPIAVASNSIEETACRSEHHHACFCILKKTHKYGVITLAPGAGASRP